MFLAKPLVSPLLRPPGSRQLPPSPWQSCLLPCVGGWGAALGLFPLPSPSEARHPRGWTLDVWRPEGCSALSLSPQSGSSAIAAQLPPAPTSACQVPASASSSSPWAPRGPGEVGIPLSSGQLSGWGGAGRWRRGLERRQPLGKGGVPGQDATVKSPSLSVFQEPVIVGGDRPFSGLVKRLRSLSRGASGPRAAWGAAGRRAWSRRTGRAFQAEARRGGVPSGPVLAWGRTRLSSPH